MTQTPTLAKPTLASATKPDPVLPASPPPQAVPTPYVRPTAKPTRPKKRHWFLLFSFLFLVGAPAGVTGWYLWERAADQYASHVSFSVRSEEKSSAIELLGGITELSGSSSSDTDVLFAFLSSQELVRRVDARADLRGAWSAVSTEQDPIFAYDPTGTIEDLLEHWERKVSIVYDSGAGLIDVRVLAFDPARAKSIAQIILEECTAMINGLSDLAREDAIRYAREELLQAQDRLRDARLSLTQFRNRTQIVDPSIDTQNQMGLLVNLQQQLADALIEFDLLQDNTTRGDDPRVTQAERRIEVIRERIDSERQNLGLGSGAESGVVFAELVGEYEGLIVDREFAETAYTATLATHDAALAAARKQSRYLAAHVKPTLAEKAKFPERENILALVLIFGFLSWSVVCLIFYSLRDRS